MQNFHYWKMEGYGANYTNATADVGYESEENYSRMKLAAIEVLAKSVYKCFKFVATLDDSIMAQPRTGQH